MSRPKDKVPLGDRTGAIQSPFEKLASLRDSLPSKELPATPVVTTEKGFNERIIIAREKKGRGGKTVTLITGITSVSLEELARQLRKALGCGANVADGTIVLQGEQESRARDFLVERGAKQVVMATLR